MAISEKKCEAKPRGRSPAEGEARLVLMESIYNCLKNETKLSFITMNPYKKSKSFARFQKIGSVHDWLRKHTQKFFLVQETNDDGSKHYHALVKAYDGKVFRNMQVDVKYLSKACIPISTDSPLPPLTVGDQRSMMYQNFYLECIEKFKISSIARTFADFLTSLWNKQRLALQRHKVSQRKLRKNTDVGRIIDYMSKECTYCIYENYTTWKLEL